MFHWFAQLAPGEQLALVGQAVGMVFSAGVYWATVRFLSRRVKEHDEHLERHDHELKRHGEEIAKLDERTATRRAHA